MHQIVLYGDPQDRQISTLLRKWLSERFAVQYFSTEEIQEEGSGPILQILEYAPVHRISVPSAILLAKRRAPIEELERISSKTTLIIDANDCYKAALLERRIPELSVCTCGFGGKDTITFSSRDEQQAVIALQRPIRLENGTICDPFEVPCCISELASAADDYVLLASAMSLILCSALNATISKNLGKICFS